MYISIIQLIIKIIIGKKFIKLRVYLRNWWHQSQVPCRCSFWLTISSTQKRVTKACPYWRLDKTSNFSACGMFSYLIYHSSPDDCILKMIRNTPSLLWSIIYLLFVHQSSLVVHTTSKTSTTWTLSVLSYSSMTVRDMSPHFAGLLQTCWLK